MAILVPACAEVIEREPQAGHRGRVLGTISSRGRSGSPGYAGSTRTLIITAENDVLRDEGEPYGRKLIGDGVEVVTTRYNATIHDFVMLNALA